jgi:hypothetical protein
MLSQFWYKSPNCQLTATAAITNTITDTRMKMVEFVIANQKFK